MKLQPELITRYAEFPSKEFRTDMRLAYSLLYGLAIDYSSPAVCASMDRLREYGIVRGSALVPGLTDVIDIYSALVQKHEEKKENREPSRI